MLGSPVSDPVGPTRPTSDPCPVPYSAPRREIPHPTSRNLIWSAAIALITFCAGIVVGVYAIPRGAESAPTLNVQAVAAVPAGVAGFAELYVATHLSGLTEEGDLNAFHPDGGPSPGPTGVWVNRAAAIAGVAIDEDIWQVTVAADVLEMIDGAYEPAGLQYFTVSVAETDAQPVAISFPNRIPAPENLSQPATAPRFTGSVPPDQASAIGEFLNAYLTGHGEVARYMAPTAGIALFPAPPYASTKIENLGADPLGRVRARLTATSANGAAQILEYTLEMSYASGVWELVTLAPATDQR